MKIWRRGRDSNSWCLLSTHDFQSCSLDQLGNLSVRKIVIPQLAELDKQKIRILKILIRIAIRRLPVRHMLFHFFAKNYAVWLCRYMRHASSNLPGMNARMKRSMRFHTGLPRHRGKGSSSENFVYSQLPSFGQGISLPFWDKNRHRNIINFKLRN